MPLVSGAFIGPYQIVAPLGAGGMGEVYRARDTTLNRDVAIKVLPESIARDPDHLARFKREAQVLAALNHPHIAQIYGFDESDGLCALVMEVVDGPTLADVIASRQPSPVAESLRSRPRPGEAGSARGGGARRGGIDDVLQVALQIAEALEAAHEKGIVHRDLKPANVKVRPDGTVKVLDFGLAKAFETAPPSDVGLTNSPTLSLQATYAGVILGTAAYMSPEQAAAKPVDKRADIWSFGVVLWEMLTGKQLFEGETISHTLADVLRAEIDFSQLPADTPPTIRQLLRRCLDRDPKNRLRDIGEARVAILTAQTPTDVHVPQRDVIVRGRWIWISATALLALLAVALSYSLWRSSRDENRVFQLAAPFPDKTTIDPGSLPAVSPDGRHVAVEIVVDGRRELWVRDLNSGAARRLSAAAGIHPFWSPDGRTLGFFTLGKLKRINVDGGPVLTVCDAPNGRGGTWSKDDVVLFTPTAFSGIFRVAAAGGTPVQVTTPDPELSETGHTSPWFLPDGRRFLYTARSSNPENTAVYLGDVGSKQRTRVLTAASNAVYTDPGYLLFVREQTLLAQRFDPRSASLSGDPAPIAERVDVFPGENQAQFSVSQGVGRASVLAYTSGWVEGVAQLTWFDRAGKITGTVGAAGAILRSPAISPDGKAVAFERFDAQKGAYDLWIYDLNRGTDSRFTASAKNNIFPVWSPDGRSIVFTSPRDGIPKVYQKATAGVESERLLDGTTRPTRATDWSRDGRYIIEHVQDPKSLGDIWVLPLAGDRKAFPYLQSEFDESDARLSPDGRWLAYVSDESKRKDVFVQTFPTATGKWQVSINGGQYPVWSRDGKRLYFLGGDRMVTAVDVKAGPVFDPGAPTPLFEAREAAFDVGSDGRFLMTSLTPQAFAAPMTVVVSWPALLKRR